MFLQRTIKSKVVVNGLGLHTGKPASLVFRPAPPDIGVHLIRMDLPNKPSVKVYATNVRATTNATTLGGTNFSVSTVEHCLSALAAFRIDNLIIELNGPEIPIGDGSAFEFCEALRAVGFVEQERPRKYFCVREPVFISDGDKQAYVMPYDGLRVTCTIDFPHPVIGRQKLDMDINETSFVREIARARTFGFLKDLEHLQAQGLALGGSLSNAIGLDQKSVLNPEGLRFPDEFVRHKILDALGDLVTLGRPFMGHLVLFKAGHDLMNRLVRKLLELPEAQAPIEMGESLEQAFNSGRITLPYPLN